MLVGVNVDPQNPGGRPSPRLLTSLGCQAVRLVSRDLWDCHDYRNSAHGEGLKVLAVVARESEGYILPDCDWYQIGNEPDQVGASSWAMPPELYVKEWRIYRETYPDLPMITAGLASGDVGYWRAVARHIEGADAMAVHPYAKSHTAAQSLLSSYRAVRPDLPIWVTEWFRDTDNLVQFQKMLKAQVEAGFWFCATDAMVEGFGLLGTMRQGLWSASNR